MSTYHEQQKRNNTIRLRAILEECPYFFRRIFLEQMANTASIKTRVVYAYDLKYFLHIFHNIIKIKRDCIRRYAIRLLK